jgi:Mg2+ and Co2+ transporter CorA
LKKCQERSGTWKSVLGNNNEGEDIQKRTEIAKDEQARLESVIEKVEVKFLDGVQKLQERVSEWYLDIIQMEQNEVSVTFVLFSFFF